MRSLIALFIALLALFAGPAAAQVVSVETYVEEWDRASQQWVRVEDARTTPGANRLALPGQVVHAATAPAPARIPTIGEYGPFRVVSEDRAELVDVTDRHSPTDFAAMLKDFPGIRTLALVEAPGTDDDRANLRVGRMIRAAGITTHVPRGGSVRSGAVELFLAGATKQIDEGAEFAVHSWIDAHGRQPKDFPMSAPANRMYLDYYAEMGMSAAHARSFYAMTNSVSFADAKWLDATEMRRWTGLPAPQPQTTAVQRVAAEAQNTPAPVIAYLDLNALLP